MDQWAKSRSIRRNIPVKFCAFSWGVDVFIGRKCCVDGPPLISFQVFNPSQAAIHAIRRYPILPGTNQPNPNRVRDHAVASVRAHVGRFFHGGSSPRRSGGKSMSMGRPMVSAAEYPKIISAAGFQLVMTPFQGLADDRIVGRFDDGGELIVQFFLPFCVRQLRLLCCGKSILNCVCQI